MGYDYNVPDKTGRIRLGFNYTGLFPELSAQVSYGNEASNYYQINNTLNYLGQIVQSDTTVQRMVWKELAMDLDIRLPFNLSKGKYSRYFAPEIQYSVKNVSGKDTLLTDLYPDDSQALAYRIYCNNFLHQSGQALQPKWGQQIDLIYRHTVNSDNLSTLSGIQSVIYFPGIGVNSGIKIYQGYQIKTVSNSYSFSNFIRFPRGYQSIQNNKMYSIASDYKIPLIYPDFSIGKLAYFKRIKSTFFYDWAWLSVPVYDDKGLIVPNDHEIRQQSYGVELTTDLHVFRFYAPIDLGFRSIYRPEFNDIQFNLLLSINFNGF